MKKAYKTIKQENGILEIYGNHHWIDIDYRIPDQSIILLRPTG
jgi:hypothetical protein